MAAASRRRRFVLVLSVRRCWFLSREGTTTANGRTIMTTHGETLSITTPTNAVTAGPRLRELTYRYQPKYASDGQPIRLNEVIGHPKMSAAALTTLLHDEAVEVF